MTQTSTRARCQNCNQALADHGTAWVTWSGRTRRLDVCPAPQYTAEVVAASPGGD